MRSEEIIANNYDQVFFGRYDTGHKHMLGEKQPTRCRFCHRDPSAVSFKKVAHAVPELLGNRQLVLTDECDECNEHFATHVEDHLAKFTKPYRVMGQVRGKKKVPSYKTFSGVSRIDFNAERGFKVVEREDDPIHEIEHEKKQVHFKFVRERYCPAAAYKALVKTAISVMPDEELENFEHARQWILCADHSKAFMEPLNLLLYFVPGPKPHKGTSIMVLRKKADSIDEELPYCMIILAFGNLQLQVVVPSAKDDRGSGHAAQFTIPRFPSAFGEDWPYGKPQAGTLDMTTGEVLEPKQCTVTMHYDSIVQDDG